MHARARVGARRRAAVVAVAATLIGAMAPAATAKAPERARRKPAPHVPVRTGLIVSVCRFSHRSLDDPIVYPGQPGAAHSHDFFGNRSTDADSTIDTLSGKATSCGIAGDTAAYWAPTLNVNGASVKPAAMFAYYAVYDHEIVHTLPIGLKILAKGGDHVRYSCFRHSMPTALYTKMPVCQPADQMSIGVSFPSCWNGTDLDSADHRSHMAYPVGGVCPDGYPVKVPRLAIWFMYRAVPRHSLITLSSGGLDTAHADYINSWDPQTLTALEHYCLDGNRGCYKEMGQVLRTLRLPRTKFALFS